MKKQTSGIIRRIDDLGRIVIPKALRDQIGVEEGQPFEISLTKNGFKLEVYKPEPDKKAIAEEWLNDNRSFVSKYLNRFVYYKDCTCCLVFFPQNKCPVSVGVARCMEKDEYDSHIGQIISFCRAIGKPEMIPEEFFE